MRTVSIDGGTKKPFKLSAENRQRLKEWLLLEHRRAQDSRFGIENEWRENIRMYEGKQPEKAGWVPFEQAPTVEVTTGATAADSVVSQAEDLIFQVKPPLTVRSRKEDFDETADAMQELVNYGVESGVWNFEPGLKEGLLDQVQLGTVIGYVPFTKTVRVTDIRAVSSFGPKIYSVAPEHFILPANATKNIQEASFCTMRVFMDKSELHLRASMNRWDIDEAASAEGESNVRKDRLKAAGITDSGPDDKLRVQVGYSFCYFDFNDGMGLRDLEVVWNMTSGNIMKAQYNRYNYRPFVLECYQDRAHLPWGLGVMKMDGPFQRMTTEIWNNHVWNMTICNTKMYQMPQEMMTESEEIYPGKRWANDAGKIEPVDMGMPNASAVQAVGLVTAMSRERTGVGNLTAPLRAGNRTPGISMLSMFQQANRRFTHPFNNIRNFASQLVMQCLYRIQEQVRAGSDEVIASLNRIMGEQKAGLIIGLMRRSDLELTDALDVQLTAASVSVNRESDRQNMVMLATQVMPLYWNAKKELAMYMAQPPFPGANKVAQEADRALDKIFHKVMKTFDQISDVRSLQIDLSAIDEAMSQLGGQQIGPQMAQMMGAGAPPQGQPAAPVGPPGILQ